MGYKRIYVIGLLIVSMGFSKITSATNAINSARDNINCDIEPGKPLKAEYGPWDFTNPSHADKLPRVISTHFTKNIELLISGNSGTIDAEIDYTLKTIPNYHRALYSIIKFEISKKRQLKNGELYHPRFYTSECYLKRAIYFQPKDTISRMLYGMHLHLTKNLVEDEKQYLYALSNEPDNAELNYNLGLLYIDNGDIEKAKKHAKVAYSQGYPLKGLNNKINKHSKK